MPKLHLSDLTTSEISSSIIKGAWCTPDQQISSACTNTASYEDPSQVINIDFTEGIGAYLDFKFDQGVEEVIDVGGGRFDSVKNYFAMRGIGIQVWDPYGRSPEHNAAVKDRAEKIKMHAATSMSVLNVIENIEARLAHIATLKSALEIGGKAFFKVWPGEGSKRNSRQAAKTAESFQAHAGIKAFYYEIATVFGIDNIKMDESRNLIFAKKTTDEPVNNKTLSLLRALSIRERELFSARNEQAKVATLFMPQLSRSLKSLNLALAYSNGDLKLGCL